MSSDLRPESLLLAFCGAHLRDPGKAVSAGSVIELTGRLGVTEHAIRATLKRMTGRGLLRSVHRGRRAYLGLASQGETVLAEGSARLLAPLARSDWDGQWVLLAFSVPESRREDRHALRTQLGWAGFGPLRNALWIAPSGGPGEAVADRLRGLGLLDYVTVFRASGLVPGDPRELVSEAWDLTARRAGYQEFLSRWGDAGRAGGRLDALARRMLLEAEWLLLIRGDPRLPSALLPERWPGSDAERLFRALRAGLEADARRLAATTLDWITV